MEGGGGHFTKNEVSLNYNAFVEHGENVDVVCHTGYFPKGPPRLRCWYGEWSGGASSVFGMPKCVGNPCNLPEISGTPGGKYVGKFSLISSFFNVLDQVIYPYQWISISQNLYCKNGKKKIRVCEAGKGQLILKCPFGVFKSPENQQRKC